MTGEIADRPASRLSCAWVETVGELGRFCHEQVNTGRREAVRLLEMEETNLLHGRRLARYHQWWRSVIAAMQGLRALYEYHERGAEWSRLVEELVFDYCTRDDEPITGREEEYDLIMEYRVHLALDRERDLSKAATLQEKVTAWNRQRGADLLALPLDAPLDAKQRNQIRSLASDISTLGHILRELGDTRSVVHYREAIVLLIRVDDRDAQAVTELNLGHAFIRTPSIRDLDAAEAAYRRSLNLRLLHDSLGRSIAMTEIGSVHYSRFRDARGRQSPVETLIVHAQAAEEYYLQALQLCPTNAFSRLSVIHCNLGNLYHDFSQFEEASKHYEKAAQYDERAGNRHNAGQTRANISIMYLAVADREDAPTQKRNALHRAQAYAEAALRDFRHYEGHAAADEAHAQTVLNQISQALAKLPQ